MKSYSTKEFERILMDNGYAMTRKNGDHCIWQKDGVPLISIPKHQTINYMICRRIIKENNLKV